MASSSAEEVIKEKDRSEENWKGLVQYLDGRNLFAPLSNSVKIKYTCIAVSQSHVILGANSGGVYCFTASDFHFTRLLANREGTISLISFSPSDNRLLAVVSGGYNVCFWEHNLDDINNEAKRFHVSSILKDGSVTDMVWDSRGTRLFYGDNQGRIAIAYVPKIARKFGGSSLFKRVDEIIHIEKGAIVQLDIWQDLLLVSTNERCCILKLQGESIESAIPIGAKAVRNGSFGACFYPRASGKPPIVYSARPRGRLWAASIAGEVISTVKPKEFLITKSTITPPSTIINTSSTSLSSPPQTYTLPSFSFHRLGIFDKQYLVMWQQDTLFVQKFHESSFSVKLWLANFQNINSLVFCDNKMYVLHDNCQNITCLSYLNMSDLLKQIVKSKNHLLTHEMLVTHTNIIKEEVPLNILSGIVNFLLTEYKESLSTEIQELVDLVTVNDTTVNDNDTPHSPIEDTDSARPPLISVEQVTNAVESNQFSMEGSEDPLIDQPIKSLSNQIEELHIEEEIEDTSTDNNKHVSSLPHTFPNTSVHRIEENGLSLPDQGISSPPPSSSSSTVTVNKVIPLTARISGDKLKEEEDQGDLVVVRSISREKRRKSKGSRKKRGSVELKQGFTQTSLLSLDDIIEGGEETVISPSQLSSTTTSLDNSPHASLPSSPPTNKHTITNITDTRSTDTTIEESGGSPRTSRSLSWDVGSEDGGHEKPFRSLSQSFEPDILRPTKLLSKVKSMASSQDGSIQKTGRMVKGLLLSSISSTPVADDVRSSPEVGESFENRRSSYKSPSPLVSPTPTYVIDDNTKQFIEATSKAMQSLNTPQIVCSPSSMKQTLLEWIEELLLYHTHLIRTHQQNINSDIFLPHDLSAKESVKELLYLCLDFQVYPDTSCVSKLLDNITTKNVNTDPFITDHENVATNPNTDHDFNINIDTETDSHTDVNTDANTNPNIDSDTDLIVEVTDPGPNDSNSASVESHTGLEKKETETSTNLYESFMRHYSILLNDVKYHLVQEDLTSACMGYRIAASSIPQETKELIDTLSPPLMWKFYQEDKQSFVSLCIQHYPSVQPWEILAICQMDLSDEGRQDSDTYLSYMNLLFSGTFKNEILVHSESLVLLSVKASLKKAPNEPVKGDNGQPLPNSHLVEWLHETNLNGLTSYCCKHCSDETCQKIIELFDHSGYWKGYLELCVSKKMTEKVWMAVSALCNLSLLHDLVKKSNSFDTPSSWQSFTALLSKMEVPVEGQNAWSWEAIMREMISVIGVDESGKILQTLDLPSNLPYSIHQLIIGLSAIHREQRIIAHDLLEKFDRYLWSVRPNSLGPYLLNMYQKEGDTNNNSKEEMSLRDLISPPPGTHPNIPEISMEDAASHWGIKSANTKCMVCGFSIIQKMSDKEGGGAIGFRCGHIYHRQCLPEQACVVCFVKNYRTKLSSSDDNNR